MLTCFAGVLGLCLPALDAPVVVDTWETATLDGTRIGYCQTSVQTLGEGNDRRVRTSSTLELALRRNTAQVRLRVEHATEETPEGKVVALLVRYLHDDAVQLRLVGKVDGDRMRVLGEGAERETLLRWGDDIVGLGRRDRLLAEKHLRPGDRFAFRAYEPVVNTVVTVRVFARGPEEVVLPGGRRTLLRVELTPDRLEAPGVSLQLPTAVFWLDAEGHIARRQIELDGLGTIVLVPATREAALAPVTATRSSDLSARSQIPLNRTLPRAAQARSATYRVTLRGDSDAVSAFVRDAHQETRSLRPDTFEVTVHPVRRDPAARGGPPAAEFLGSSYYLDTGDGRVRELAGRVVAGETDPWLAAQRVERWVRANLRVDNAAPLAPASAVARDLRGDCRHAAFLTTALCRASGVPARTAIGLVYCERNKQPSLGFHMWSEVYVNGQWLGLDGTPGIGPVSVGHLKITDHSWDGVTSLTPLLPLQRVLGKATVEILAVDP